MIVDVYNLKKEVVEQLELADDVFAAPAKPHLLHEVVLAQLAGRRSGSACTKERNAVAGGGRKPYRQKGTGRARQGTRRAVQWVGGGVAHGPRPRSYSYRPPRNVRRGALRAALSLRAREQNLLVLDGFELDGPKTREAVRALNTLEVGGALVVDRRENDALRLSVRNLPAFAFLPPEGVNVFDVLRHEKLVVTKRAVLDLQDALQRPRGGGR
jgi:large subunit ribosomal protein L4